MARMLSKVLLLLVLLGSVSSDRLRFHLENLVDRNVSACYNFYEHACSQHVDPKEFFKYRVTKLYEDAIAAVTPGSDKNSPISYDLIRSESLKFNLEDNNYENLSRERCKDELSCYSKDRQYWAYHLARIDIKPTFSTVDSDQSYEDQIRLLIEDTSTMIDSLINRMNTSFIDYKNAYPGVTFHNLLQARIQIIEFMKSNGTYTDFHEVKEITETMKNRMIKIIENSPWLNHDETSEHLKYIKEIVKSIRIYHDFDELDQNITIIQKLNRDFSELYFGWKRNTGVDGLDILYAVQDAYDYLKLTSSPEMLDYIARVKNNFGFNAFYSPMKAVTMLAPLMYKPALCTEILKEPIVTYSVLGHELYHSLFNDELYPLYDHRSKCIETHYENACSKFRKGACASGPFTIDEDAPDLHSYRLIYSMLHEHYTAEEMMQPIDGMDTTLEQAFFYYAASGWCAHDGERSQFQANNDPHSAKNIRINAAFSLMPEFTKAFG